MCLKDQDLTLKGQVLIQLYKYSCKIILKIIWGKINYLNRILYNLGEGRKYKIISKMILQGSVVQVVGKDWKTHRMARSLFKVLKANQYDK